jgi:hypothetical protein
VWSGVGVATSADIGFEATGCCGAGLYVAGTKHAEDDAEEARVDDTKHGDDDADDPRVDEILEGGIELGVVPPIWDQRLRLRLRGGKAGTPPKSPSVGRSGFTGSAALLFRLWSVPPPAVDEAAPTVDLFVGFSAWSFGRERTSAGPMGDSEQVNAALFGVRIGGEYGVDFR